MNRGKIKWIVIGMLAAFLVVMVSWHFLGRGGPSPAPKVVPEIGALAPDFKLPTLNGQTVRLSELRAQPLLLNFWAIRCPPCRMEIPYLQEAFEEKGKEIKFIAINLGEPAGAVREFAEDEGISFTIALDTDMTVGKAYNIRYIPTTFLIDGEGIICSKKVGAFRSEGELVNILESL